MTSFVIRFFRASPRLLLTLLVLMAGLTQVQASIAETREQPSLSVTTIDGAQWELSEQRGHWVVVNFWATWCSPCLAEMPDLDAFDQSRDDVSVIGLAFEEIELDELRAFLVEHPVRYPIAPVDTWNPPADFAQPRGLPTTYLIDPAGNVAKLFIGPVTGKMLEQAISAAGNDGANDAEPES